MTFLNHVKASIFTKDLLFRYSKNQVFAGFGGPMLSKNQVSPTLRSGFRSEWRLPSEEAKAVTDRFETARPRFGGSC